MTTACESCGMPIETGRYCGYCTDETGNLQSFDERFERMTAWQARRHPGASRQEIERQTLDYMATMPAWKDHPRVTSGGLWLSTCTVSHNVLQVALWGQPWFAGLPGCRFTGGNP